MKLMNKLRSFGSDKDQPYPLPKEALSTELIKLFAYCLKNNLPIAPHPFRRGGGGGGGKLPFKRS